METDKDPSVIPEGLYCYDQNGVCPYWSRNPDQPEQESGSCSYLGINDWDPGPGVPLLWDQVKECGENLDEFSIQAREHAAQKRLEELTPSREQLHKWAEDCEQRRKAHYDTRKVPMANEVTVKCICCGEVVQPVWATEESPVTAACYAGVVGTIEGGYGTAVADLAEFVIGICDPCIVKAKEDERLIEFFDGMRFLDRPQ